MSKKNVSYLLSICAVVSSFVPISAGAISISGMTSGEGSVSSGVRAGANSTLETAINTSFGKGGVAVDSDVNADVNANLGRYHRDLYPNANIGGETKMENSVRLNSSSNDNSDDDESNKENNKDGDKKDKNDNKEERKLEDKVNRGAWVSWFARFFGRAKTDINISVVAERENATSTTISWKTNAETKGKVYFSSDVSLLKTGTTTGLSFVENSDFSIEHKSTLSNLSANTRYYYFIEYQGRDSKVFRSKVHDFKTKAIINVDVTAPRVLFSTVLNITGTSANVVWVTNESSNSKIWVSNQAGVSTTGTPTKVSGSVSVFHGANLSGLATGTKYFYVVGSTDASGNTVFSAESSFETGAE